ncbi:MAG TPA: hypothetical protein ENI60_06160 [Candidatus Fraserbacteria bacterium]|nr:hypothetical protein [Candidatus Fraserbacteria bacterium]
MSRWNALLRGGGYLISLLYLLLIAAGLLGLRFGAISPAELLALLQRRWGVLALYILAALALVGAIYCALRFIGLYRQRRRLIEYQSTRGLIQIAPLALRDFAQQFLERELGLTRCRVQLEQSAQGGLRLRVQAQLPASGNLMELGEQIQARLKERVEQQIGITVDEVAVFAPRIGAPATQAESEAVPAEPGADLSEIAAPPAPKGEDQPEENQEETERD